MPERYAAASPAERLPLGVPVLLTHGGRDDIVPPVMSERFAAAARAAGDDVELVLEPDEDHFGHLDPAQPAVAGGDRVADPLSRAAAEAADAADPLAGFRDRFVARRRRGSTSTATRSAGCPVATRDRLAALTAEWGERLVGGWPDWIDAPVRAGDADRARVIGAAPGEVVACDSTTVNLFKLAGAALDARGPAARSSPTATTSPPTATCSRGSPRSAGSSCGCSTASRTPRRCRAAAATLVVLSHVDYRTGALRRPPALQAAARDAAARR